MISIKLRNFRGSERAEITCGPIALLSGKNAAGKSSIAQATGAALSGNPLPFAGLTKAAGGMLVHVGAAEAMVELWTEGGTSRMTWPACELTQSGAAPPHASLWAAGLGSVALLPAKDRARVLGEYLHADPTREDLVQALADVELGQAPVVAAVWKLIEDQGWDGAHSLRKETGAELKGRWRQVTGANYGSRIAVSWTPPGWGRDLEDANDNDLSAALMTAKSAHLKAIAAAAVSGAERQRLAEIAAPVEELTDALRDAEIEEARLEEEVTKAEATRAALPPAGAETVMPCPHCGKSVVLRRINLAESQLEKAETISATELRKRRQAIAAADGALGRLRGELGIQQSGVAKARDRMQLALDARTRLAQTPAETGADAAATKTALERAEQRLAAFRQYHQADELRGKIAGNELLLGILAPDGLRARKLARVLEAFNTTQLEPLCAAAEWKRVSLDPEMILAYGGRPYALLSTSEQYRVRAVVQLAMARLDGSEMVVFDAADVLDGPTRSQLFQMLEEAGLPALVCLTLSRPSQCPDLAAIGIGASYWLADGIAEPLHRVAEVAA